MSPTLQVKVLRVLQEGTFTPVGDTVPREVDVRVIAATNRDLKQMVERGEFREDLYYRVHVIALTVPPLRDRRDDIPLLAEHFLLRIAERRGVRPQRLTRACLDRMLEYRWPGNVRELENEMERLAVLAPSEGSARAIPEELLSPRIRLGRELIQSIDESLPEAVDALEKTMIFEVLKRNRWNKTRAAQELHISRRNLIRKVQKYRLDPRQGPRR
jgi:DNA-binding NtrC family response regulator